MESNNNDLLLYLNYEPLNIYKHSDIIKVVSTMH
jgi:hypothetical protein